MLLSPHFTLGEFTKSSHDIPNKPDYTQIYSMKELCKSVLEPLREHFGAVNITSGFRCPELNKAAGGAPSSQHLRGEAADIKIPGVRNDAVWNYIKNNLPFDQLIAEKLKLDDGATGWIHVSYAPTLRRDAISYLGKINGKHTYVKGLAYI